MARLTRQDIFDLATAKGWVKGTPMTQLQRDSVRLSIRQALAQSDAAPTRVFDGTGNSRPMTAAEAVENLLEELV